jgi:hypothetical protein
MAELCNMSIVTSVRRILERRWLLVPLAVAIGLVSAFILRLKLQTAYYEYWVFPRDKAVDGYLYPQLRYTIFDIFLVLWCVAGLIASVISVRSAIASRNISRWALSTLLIYFGLFALLILGGIAMMAARRHGY